MRNAAEIDQLKSYQIKEVKVITNPGARYDSQTNAVIRITTLRNVGDGFSLDSRTAAGLRRYFFGKEDLSLNYRTGGLDIFARGQYSFSRTCSANDYSQTAWLTRVHDISMISSRRDRSQTANLQVGFNYATVSGHSFGTYYQPASRPEKAISSSVSEFLTDGFLAGASTNRTRVRVSEYDHLVDAYYSGRLRAWTAEASLSFLWRHNSSARLSDENSGASGHSLMQFYDCSRSRMLADELNFSRKLRHGSVSLGASMSDSRRADDFATIDAPLPDNSNCIRETNTGIYFQTTQRLGRINLQLGLRYEHIDSRYFAATEARPEQSRSYNQLLPDASVMIPMGRTFFQFAYTRRYVRPLYGQLRSKVTYNNAFLYETGNPGLRTSYIDHVSQNFSWKWLMLMTSYRRTTDRIITIAEPYAPDPEITLLRKVNSSRPIHALEAFASITPGFIGGFYYPSLMCGVTAQFYTIDFRGSDLRLNRPMGIVRFNNIFRLVHNWIITADYSWSSSGDGDNYRISSLWSIDLAVRKSFSTNFDLQLSLRDIFNSARRQSFASYGGAYENCITKSSPSRAVELTLGYRFNVAKSKYKGRGAGASELKRF